METDIHDKVQRLIALAKAQMGRPGAVGNFHAPEVQEVAEYAASLEAELAQLKQPAHVLAEAERLLRPNGREGLRVTDVWWGRDTVLLQGPDMDDAEGTDLVSAYAAWLETAKEASDD